MIHLLPNPLAPVEFWASTPSFWASALILSHKTTQSGVNTLPQRRRVLVHKPQKNIQQSSCHYITTFFNLQFLQGLGWHVRNEQGVYLQVGLLRRTRHPQRARRRLLRHGSDQERGKTGWRRFICVVKWSFGFSHRCHCRMTSHAMAARGLQGGQTLAVFWHSEASLTQKNSRLKISTDLFQFSTSLFVRLRRDFIPHLTRVRLRLICDEWNSETTQRIKIRT